MENKILHEDSLKLLKEILSDIEYGMGEVYSASESLPDYDANSSAKDYMSQAESYLDDAVYKLEEVINTNKRN